MKTPAGKECKHYYQDFHRGRDIQECRLAKRNLDSEKWHPDDCSKCPVPEILMANADPDIVGVTTGANGVITATAHGDMDVPAPGTYVLTPALNGGRVTWTAVCTPATLC